MLWHDAAGDQCVVKSWLVDLTAAGQDARRAARFPAAAIEKKIAETPETPQGQPTKETSPYGIVPHTS